MIEGYGYYDYIIINSDSQDEINLAQSGIYFINMDIGKNRFVGFNKNIITYGLDEKTLLLCQVVKTVLTLFVLYKKLSKVVWGIKVERNLSRV
jgi:hypothetical protein